MLLQTKFQKIVYLTVLVLVLSSIGCAGTAPKFVPAADTAQSMNKFIRQYEKTFDPSMYQVPVTIYHPKPDSNLQNSPVLAADSTSQDSLEYTSGYRVQVLTTQSIDEANTLKDTLEYALPTEWVYIIYHVPYYKVRVGNFFDMPSANKMKRGLTEKGYKDAWVVPDEIVKNPPIKLPPVRMPVDTMMQH